MKAKIGIIMLYFPAAITLIKTICGVIWAKMYLPNSVSAFVFKIYHGFTMGKLWFLYPVASILAILATVGFFRYLRKNVVFGVIVLNVISITCWTMLSVLSQ